MGFVVLRRKGFGCRGLRGGFGDEILKEFGS